MKLNRESQFRRVDSDQDKAIGDNFYREFIERFNDLVDSTGRQKIEIEFKKEAEYDDVPLDERGWGWIENPYSEKDKVYDAVLHHFRDILHEGASSDFIFEMTEQTDRITIENGHVYVWVDRVLDKPEKIEIPKETIKNIRLYNPDNPEEEERHKQDLEIE